MHRNAPIYVAISGLLVLILGIVLSSLVFPRLQEYLIKQETALEEGSRAFEAWKKPPFPFKLRVYLFNVMNPDEVQEGSNPILKEMGPYIYDEFRVRKVLSVDEENDTIKYLEKKFYYFNQDESGCRSEDDRITILNIAVATTAIKVNRIASMALPLLNSGLPYLFPGIKNVFTTATVRDILFEGMKMACESEEVETMCDAIKGRLPRTVRLAENGRDYLTSLFHHLNGSDEGPYEIERGIKTSKGKIVGFKNVNALTQWGGDYCNRFKGTDLTVNPSLRAPPSKVEVFSPDICRSLSAEFEKIVEFSGLETYSFKSKHTFGELKEDSCFCTNIDMNSNLPSCGPLGTMNLEPCIEAPILVSQPHFINGDQVLLNYAQGLKPEAKKHETVVIMEPKTGLALLVKVRIQMNIPLQKIAEIDVLQNITEGIFPFVWMEEGAEVPQEIIAILRENFNKFNIFVIVKYLLIISGVFLLAAALILAMIKDKVACFHGKDLELSGSQISRNDRISATDINQIKYPTLYPQLNNRNMPGGMTRRNSTREAWRFD